MLATLFWYSLSVKSSRFSGCKPVLLLRDTASKDFWTHQDNCSRDCVSLAHTNVEKGMQIEVSRVKDV